MSMDSLLLGKAKFVLLIHQSGIQLFQQLEEIFLKTASDSIFGSPKKATKNKQHKSS